MKKSTGQPRRLTLVELNEVNLEVARRYVDALRLRSLAVLCGDGLRRSSSEARYEQLEPWIQWVSAHSGLSAAEHGVFRLGDIVGTSVPQLFEQLEARGLSIGAVSPMNTENRLRRPAYFLPDPWTRTPTDGSFWSRALSGAISQAVNDNSDGRITPRSAALLLLGILRFARPRHYPWYLRLALRSRGAPWRKALFLDLFLHDLHWTLMRRHRPDLSIIFLNAGAHIQHHYFLNSPAVVTADRRNPPWYVGERQDPVAEMLQVYDLILADYLRDEDSDLVVATGLTQQPYDRVKFYYRLKDHEAFLRLMQLRVTRVTPRMTRDFLVEFDTEQDAAEAQQRLAALHMAGDGLPLFGEIDNRGRSLFVTLTYPHEIGPASSVSGGPVPIAMAGHVVFVAIKNGMHDGRGFVWCRGQVARHAPADGAHVKHLYDMVMQHFGAARDGSRAAQAGQPGPAA